MGAYRAGGRCSEPTQPVERLAKRARGHGRSSRALPASGEGLTQSSGSVTCGVQRARETDKSVWCKRDNHCICQCAVELLGRKGNIMLWPCAKGHVSKRVRQWQVQHAMSAVEHCLLSTVFKQ